MLNPLITMVILTVVFSAVFAPNVPHYSLFVIIGLLAWNLFALGSTQGLASIVDSGQLIRKVAIPKEIFPIAAVGANLAQLPVCARAVAGDPRVLRVGVTAAVAFVPLGIALITVFTLGVALFMATLNVFFRDVRYLYEAALLAWFYATPIFYPLDILPPDVRAILRLNPMTCSSRCSARRSTRARRRRGPRSWLAAAESLVALALGWTVFRRYQARFIDYV